ncbi:MAG TPA: hypothetical protein VJH24_04215 [Candidatus Bilamarchaeaceae archaeon]|nr:hypothetical protein [Candidatus Bilamarchaeaceae archaeon]
MQPTPKPFPQPARVDNAHSFFRSRELAVEFHGPSDEIEKGIWERQSDKKEAVAKFARLGWEEPDTLMLCALRLRSEVFVLHLDLNDPKEVSGYTRYLPDFVRIPEPED